MHADLAQPAPRTRLPGVAALLVVEAALLALAVWLGWLPVLLGTLTLFFLWRCGPDFHWPLTATMGAAALTLYTGGHLTRDLAVGLMFFIPAMLLAAREYGARRVAIPATRTTVALAFYVFTLVLGVLLGVSRGNPLKTIALELAGLLSLLFALFSPLYRLHPRGMQRLCYGGLAVAYLSAAFGFYAFATLHRRLGDAWFSPIPAMMALVLLSVAVFDRNGPRRLGAVALSIPLLTHLLLSFTRGFWLGFIAGALGLFGMQIALSERRGKATFRAAVALGGLALLVAVSFFALQSQIGGGLSESLGSRFSSSFSTETTAATGSNIIRLVEWETVLQLLARSPFVGYGAGAWLDVKDPFFGFRVHQPYIHNMLLFQWFKYGLMGLIALPILFWAFLTTSWRRAREADSVAVRVITAAVFANTLMIAVISLTNYSSLTEVWISQPLGLLWGLVIPLRSKEGSIDTDWA